MRLHESPLATKSRLLGAYSTVVAGALAKSRHYRVADQFIGAAVGVMNNVAEAQSAESLADFLHKLKIAQKECTELEWMLPIAIRLSGLNSPASATLSELVLEINKILSASIATSRKRLKKN